MDTIKVEKNGVRLIAHRGLSGIERENTNAAFVAAGNRSYYGIETDVHRTADGEFVIVHDNDLKRVAGEDLAVETSSLSQLQSVVLLDKDGGKSRADLRVSTLQNYISICKCYGKHAVLELKSSFTQEELEQMIAQIRGLDYLEQVTFISFHLENLVLLRKQLPEQSAQYLFKEMSEELVELLTTHKLDADVYYRALTKEWVERLHENGCKVNCWTVDEKERAEELIAMGVDFITSNILE